MRSLLSVCSVIVLLTAPACVKAPPNLSPQGTAAFNKTRVTKSLDVLRDTVVLGNQQTPPVFSTEATRKVVTYHRSILVILDTGGDWVAKALATLDELKKDLPALDAPNVAPYITLTQTLLKSLVGTTSPTSEHEHHVIALSQTIDDVWLQEAQ